MNAADRRLQRSTTNRMIAGVCAGIGEYANMDPTIVRLLAALLFFLTGPGIIVAYLVMALIIPEKDGAAVQ
ncbi:MAG TPA: PspC domain-containing protein [Anaerolineales bacterium]|nr:PspC domain-containing protein [Anaerolineales bacterium]